MDNRIEKINKIFLDYTNLYEHSSRVTLKIDHTIRVAKNCYMIGKSLNFSKDDLFLAYVIGICHDIGRFEQLKNFNSFNDKACGIDHADYSNKVLFDDNLIEMFKIDKSLYSIIKTAVYYHNKKDVPNNLNERELLFCNIIRDADKLDILYALITSPLEDLFWYSNFDDKNISNNIIKSFYNNELIEYTNIKSNADQLVVFFAYIFDLNFKRSYQKIKEEKYYSIFTSRLCKKFTSKEVIIQIKEIYNYTQNFIDNKLK